MPRAAVAAIVLLVCSLPVRAEEPFEGQTLISPMNSNDAFLLDMDGTVVQTWHGGNRPASMAYMLSDGSILRPCTDPSGSFSAGGAGGRIQRIDADDRVVWDFYFSNADHQQHHDIEPMPNGNVLLIAWERKTREEAEAAGRQSIGGEMWPTLIVEVEPVGATGGDIVWEWHLWDHLIQDADPAKPDYGVVADHPEWMDINYGSVTAAGDWIHANAIDYHPGLDQIVFSSRTTNEFYVIDHGTTTEEAAGHTGGARGMGGDILYRWGNPEAYDRGSSSDCYFYVVHGVNWIDAGLPGEGNLLAFNNGDRPGVVNDYSSVDEIVPPVDGEGNYSIGPGSPFGPSAPAWTYGGPGTFYGGASQCGAFRLPNGNTLICVAQSGYLFEVTQSGTTLWDYDHPANIARAQRYWEDETAVSSEEDTRAPRSFRLLASSPNPFHPSTRVGFVVPREARVRLEVFDVGGRRVAVLADGRYGPGEFHVRWDGVDGAGRNVSPGVYFVRMEAGGFSATQKMALLR